VADLLRIGQPYLEAIEKGEIEKLPGGFFYRSFVRQYAKYLRLDEFEVEVALESLKPQTPVASAHPERFPIQVPPMPSLGAQRESIRRVPGSLITLVLVIVLCAGLFSLWVKYRENLQHLISGSPRTEPQDQAQAAAPAQTPAPAPVQNTSPAMEKPVAVPQPEPQPPAAPTENPPNKLGPEVQGTRFQVSLNATEDAWVQFSSAGKILYIGVLKAGESKSLEAANTARLMVGNSGGLNLKINGQALGPLGPRGQPRTVTLTPAGVQPVAPKPPAESKPAT
jgi:cytoskeleton protein RodZ